MCFVHCVQSFLWWTRCFQKKKVWKATKWLLMQSLWLIDYECMLITFHHIVSYTKTATTAALVQPNVHCNMLHQCDVAHANAEKTRCVTSSWRQKTHLALRNIIGVAAVTSQQQGCDVTAAIVKHTWCCVSLLRRQRTHQTLCDFTVVRCHCGDRTPWAAPEGLMMVRCDSSSTLWSAAVDSSPGCRMTSC